MLDTTLDVLAGLVIFLVGLERMAQGFASISDEQASRYIDRFTTNRFTGVVTGMVVCLILDSSSVTIMMIIAMIEGRLLTFSQAMGVVLGANIGTTFGAQIIAFDVAQYAPIMMTAGFVAYYLFPMDIGWVRKTGSVCLGLGLLFFGLDYLSESVKPIAEQPEWQDWLRSLGEEPWKGALAGGALTVLIQSSSATVGIAVKMVGTEALTLYAGVAIMLGAELGTVSNTLVAAVGRSRAAIRTAVFHLLFNLGSVIVGLLAVAPLVAAGKSLSWAMSFVGIAPDDARHVANAQLVFNVIGVGVVIWFVPLIGRILEWLIPDGRHESVKDDPASSDEERRGEAGDGERPERVEQVERSE